MTSQKKKASSTVLKRLFRILSYDHFNFDDYTLMYDNDFIIVTVFVQSNLPKVENFTYFKRNFQKKRK